MKRGVALLLVILAVAVVWIMYNQTSLSEEERQKRAEDYALLVETLQAVGYEQGFDLKETNSMEENLRRLWRWKSSQAMISVPKNAELLISLGNYDFIAEGLRSRAASHPYYDGWPRDPAYRKGSEKASFDADEALYLLLLLAQADLPEPHAALREVLIQSGVDALPQSVYGRIWVYYEYTSPGLLARVAPDFWEKSPSVSAEMPNAFRAVGTDIQNLLVEAIDVDDLRSGLFRPTFCPTFAEAEALLRAYPTQDPWAGGYLRIVDPPTIEGVVAQRHLALRNAMVYAYSQKTLTAVTNPAHARFAVYEAYTDPVYYSTYVFDGSGDRAFDVFLWNLDIRIVDLVSGEEIFSESTLGNPPPGELSFPMYTSGFATNGGYHHSDFDYGRYAAVMAAHMEEGP